MPRLTSRYPLLHQSIEVNPQRALELLLLLLKRANDRNRSSPLVIDTHIATAELYLQAATAGLPTGAALDTAARQTKAAAALRHAHHAITTAARSSTNNDQILAATAVYTDVVLFTGDPDAANTCTQYRTVVEQMSSADHDRITVASAMHAVAVYHRDRDAGYRLLTDLRHGGPAHPRTLAAMLDRALNAMNIRSDHTTADTKATSRQSVPGGILHPGLTGSVDYLASRLLPHQPPPSLHPPAMTGDSNRDAAGRTSTSARLSRQPGAARHLPALPGVSTATPANAPASRLSRRALEPRTS